MSPPGLSLNAGIFDGNASNARLLTQFPLFDQNAQPGMPQLDPSLPSPAEALAVMAGDTLLLSITDAPFVEFYVCPTIEAFVYFVLTETELLEPDNGSWSSTVLQRITSGTAIRFRKRCHISKALYACALHCVLHERTRTVSFLGPPRKAYRVRRRTLVW